MSNYYCLVAGLPDLSFEDGKLSTTLAEFKATIYPDLSSDDKKLIDLFYLKFDHLNLLRLLKDKETVIEQGGNFLAEQLNELIALAKEGETEKKYPSYLFEFVSSYQTSTPEEQLMQENRLTGLYYNYAMNCTNQFVASWFEFNLDMNNVLVALTARKYKWDVASNIIGQTDICEAIRTSNARDFGLTGTLSYFEQLVRISEIPELVERERKIDVLRWNWMEDETFFNYFTIERIFVFLLKLEIIDRWISLDKEKGSQQFRNIIDSLKNDVQIPEEFR